MPRILENENLSSNGESIVAQSAQSGSGNPRFLATAFKIAIAVVIGFFIVHAVFRDKIFDYFVSELDAWVRDGGRSEFVQSQVVDNCRKLVWSQHGVIDLIQTLTYRGRDIDVLVGACVTMTLNRVHKQPLMQQSVGVVCDGSNDFLLRLCRRSGLVPMK